MKGATIRDEGQMASILDTCRGQTVKTFEAGAVLMEEQEASDRLLVLIEGEIAVTKGGTEVARITEPGSVFGEISALLAVPTSARVVARDTVRAYEIQNASKFLRTSNDLVLHTARILARRLADATTYLADIKRQYQGHTDHFGMVDQVLETLLQQQDRWPEHERPRPRRTREDDPRL